MSAIAPGKGDVPADDGAGVGSSLVVGKEATNQRGVLHQVRAELMWAVPVHV